MGRFRRFFKSTYRQVISEIEDPESMLKQYIKDMEKEIFVVKDVISKQIGYLQNFQKQQEEAKLLVIKREKQAEIATKAGEEALAKKASNEKVHYQAKTEEYAAYITETEAGIEDLKEKLYTLEREYLNLVDKKNSLIARANRAKAYHSINQTLEALKSEELLNDFQRINDEINHLNGHQKVITKTNEIEELDEIDLRIEKLKESKVAQ
ncbi:PspA/IM30 family protein [Shimazuella sp. AN120528]|uniref:PspA/IM30 family protein n=1 Tax=Shimazuella soli TaxID=1892854 RepID=UPI001F0CF008|nr:PspA/IM30 family protein [Shimazuella soli]MCH5586219.1 PspA/IM30 family protein [Shimazuella soli]